MMEFTYKAYRSLIELLKKHGYQFISYNDCNQEGNVVIFRHDIDNSLEKALEIAKIEQEYNIKSTYFVLLSTDFYNIFSKRSNAILKEITRLGHDVGLHFDETRYEIGHVDDLEHYINYEKAILEAALGSEINCVSMHRPSRWILDNDIQFKNMINSYSKVFFNDYKYLSDSRMHWREDVLKIIASNDFEKLHILTHPFWYSDTTETIKDKVSSFIENASKERYHQMRDNIRDLEEILK